MPAPRWIEQELSFRKDVVIHNTPLGIKLAAPESGEFGHCISDQIRNVSRVIVLVIRVHTMPNGKEPDRSVLDERRVLVQADAVADCAIILTIRPQADKVCLSRT